MLDTSLKKKRAVGLAILALLLTLFLLFNRIPKLDTVRADLAIATSSQQECFQGFCIETREESSLLSKWWNFSITYLRLVALGMTFAFLVAGVTEAFLFPTGSSGSFATGGVRGSLKGLIVGPAMNLCSACIVPISSAFRQRGASIESTLAIVQGSSTLNLPAMIMAAMVFAPMIGGTRIALSLVGALLIGPLVAMVAGEQGRVARGLGLSVDPIDQDRSATWGEALSEGFVAWIKASFSYLIRLGPIMVLAGFVSAFVIQWVSPETVATYLGDNWMGVVVAATFGLLINVPLLFEIPLVAALLLVGMGTAPAATLLFAAAAGGPITFWGLARVVPKRGILAFAASIWVVAIAGGIGVMLLGTVFPTGGGGLNASVASAMAADDLTASGRNFQMAAGGGADTANVPIVMTRDPSEVVVDPPVPVTNGEQPASVTPFTNVALTALRNSNEWADEIMNYRPGVVMFDYDSDGDTDFFITSEAGASNFLYRNEGDGAFTDVAESAGVSSSESNSSGAVSCDLDNDGHKDLYVGARGIASMGPDKSEGDGLDFRSAMGDDEASRRLRAALTDRIFHNNGDGTFSDITESAVGESVNLRSASSVACADVDNDGWLDIYVGNMIDEDFLVTDSQSHPGHYNLLYRNNGDLTFDEIGESAGVRGQQIVQIEQDEVPVASGGTEYVGYDPSVGDKNGNRVGDPTGRTQGVMFFDYDDDGDQDLWVANDGDVLGIYRNDSTNGAVTFSPVSDEMGLDIVGRWKGFAVGDYNGDGRLDVFATNQGFHLRHYPPIEDPGRGCRYIDQFDWGTCLHALLENNGPSNGSGSVASPPFINVAASTPVRPSPVLPPESLFPETVHSDWDVPTGLGAYDFGYGATFFDYDNNGTQDLYWLGSENARGEGPGGDLIKSAGRMLRGDGQGTFEDITARAHLLDIIGVDYSVLDRGNPDFDPVSQRMDPAFHENGKGLAHGDLNGDGYVDLVGTNSSGPIWATSGDTTIPAAGTVFVWLNGGGANHWLTLRLRGRMGTDGTGSNAGGIGARVYVETTTDSENSPLVQVQEVRAGSSYLSMDSIELEFGLGESTIVDEIRVLWPSGRKQTLVDIPADQVLEITEPEE